MLPVRHAFTFCLFALLLLFGACTTADNQPELDRPEEEQPPEITYPPSDSGAVKYLALGDSYTIGEAVPQEERYPRQLADSFNRNGVEVGELRIIARTGWTTGDLDAALDAAAINPGDYNLVSLLVGVNNQYRGYPLDEYRVDFADLLDRAIGYVGGNPNQVFVISIPDYGVTPFGQVFGSPSRIAEEIDDFNAANLEISERRGVRYFDITPISREALNDRSLIASDGLHPSGEMYTRWVEEMLPELLKLLGK